MRKLILWLYYNVLMFPKVIHFVNYACHVQTQMCSSCFCTFTRRYVIILYFTPSHERLMLDVTTAIKLFLLLILTRKLFVQHLTNSHVCWMHVKIDGYEVKFRNREHSRSGGVGLYIRSDDKYKLRNDIVNTNTDIEHYG